jgi:hypothetical protein
MTLYFDDLIIGAAKWKVKLCLSTGVTSFSKADGPQIIDVVRRLGRQFQKADPLSSRCLTVINVAQDAQHLGVSEARNPRLSGGENVNFDINKPVMMMNDAIHHGETEPVQLQNP